MQVSSVIIALVLDYSITFVDLEQINKVCMKWYS